MVRIINFIKNMFQHTFTGGTINQETEEQRRQELNLAIQSTLQNQLVGLHPPSVPPGLPPSHANPESPINQNTPSPNVTNQESNILWDGKNLDKKLSMIRISEFNGSEEDWLKWSRKVKVSFGEAGLVSLLTSKQISEISCSSKAWSDKQ